MDQGFPITHLDFVNMRRFCTKQFIGTVPMFLVQRLQIGLFTAKIHTAAFGSLGKNKDSQSFITSIAQNKEQLHVKDVNGGL